MGTKAIDDLTLRAAPASTDQLAIQLTSAGLSRKVTLDSIRGNPWPQDFTYYSTFAGYGSTATKIPYFTGLVENVITDGSWSIDNSSTDGFSVTILKTGLYEVNFLFNSSASGFSQVGVSRNGNVTTNLGAQAASNRLTYSNFPAVSGVAQYFSFSATRILDVNDIIRPHTSGVTPSNSTYCAFWIKRV